MQCQVDTFFLILLFFTFTVSLQIVFTVISGTSRIEGTIKYHFMTQLADRYAKYAHPSCLMAAHESCLVQLPVQGYTHFSPFFYSGQDGQHWNLRPVAFLQTKTTDFI